MKHHPQPAPEKHTMYYAMVAAGTLSILIQIVIKIFQ